MGNYDDGVGDERVRGQQSLEWTKAQVTAEKKFLRMLVPQIRTDVDGKRLLQPCCTRTCSPPVTTRSPSLSLSRRSSCAQNASWSLSGHTVRLLDTAESFHRQLVPREPEAGQPKVITPLMTLRDPDLTKVLIVTLPETTPVIEAQALQDDLRRAGIEPFAWVINASLLAAHPTDPVLQQRANAEVPLIRRVTDELAHRVALMPFQVSEPSGPERLRELLAPRQSTTSHLGVRSS